MNTFEQQALFEIVMAVGQGLALQPMLQSSLAAMLRKLGCNMGAVAKGGGAVAKGGAASGAPLEWVHSVPHHIKHAPELLQISQQALAQGLDPRFPLLLTRDDQHFMVFELPDYGLLLLAKTGPVLSKATLGTLAMIAQKLALACLACEQAQAVQAAQDRTQLLLDAAAEAIGGVDLQGRCTFANASFLRALGCNEAADLLGQDLAACLPLALVPQAAGEAHPLAQKRHETQALFRRRDGRAFPVEYWAHPILRHGELVGAVLTFFDVSERQRAKMALQISEARLYALVHTIPDMIWMKDPQGVFVFCNPVVERMLNAREADIIGKTDFDFFPPEQAQFFRQHDLYAIQAGRPRINEETMVFADNGQRVVFETIKAPTYDANGHLMGVLGVARDITERKAYEEQIKNLAFYDPLTGLPNRRLVLDRLQHALRASARSGQEGALLFLDLDNFKVLNDTLGHDQGDHLLQQVAARLSSSLRDCDTAARFGGDEFVVMLENLNHDPLTAATEAEALGEKLLHLLNQPYDLAGHSYHNTPSIGVALFRDCQDSVDELMKRADLAMYQAKAAGRNTLRFFDPQMQAAITARTEMEKDLRVALQQGQFLLYYQPQVDAQRRITGAEALVRWLHPERGMVSPAAFIPAAEDCGLILPLGAWVLQTACAQLATWARTPQWAQLTLAVNVSAHQFRQPQFVAQVLAELQRSGANPQRLKLELTESLLLHDVEDIIAKMTQLKAHGVGFSMDDFGTGYSSLSYLKRLPLDQLKIDQSFVRDVLEDPHDAAIAQAIVTLAQSLDLAVIAEGVETAAQQDWLAAHQCYAYQGYLYSRPVPAPQFEALLPQGVAVN